MSGKVIWMTGLPCSGKTTLAEALQLAVSGVYILDGDEMRRGLCADLGFSPKDRQANLLRIAHVAGCLARQGAIVACSVVSPSREVRAEIRRLIGSLSEVYVKCSVEECIRRDVKGMYAEALRGDRPGFTGIGAPYEAPESPELILDTENETLETSLQKLKEYLKC